ncbi:MAG: hypothetical protein ACRD2P_17615, partial [Terriglobia bacterium]
EQRTAGSEADNTIAFYGAESAVENMSYQLATLFSHTVSPTPAQISALDAQPPSITVTEDGVSRTIATFPAVSTQYPYGGYYIWNSGMPASLSSTSETIGGTGPLAGLQGVVTPFTLTAIAQGPNNTEVKMIRQVQEVAVPIFEFGIFSDNDLSFFAGPVFNFGGRVATNGNLFLAEGPGSTLTLPAKVTSFKDVVASQLENGWTASSQYGGTVNIITSPGNYRALAETEGSVTGGPGSSANPNWNTISLTDYNGNLENSTTGVKYLNMSFAIPGSGNQPINIIERAQSSDTSLLSQARLENQASVRILLSDSTSDLPDGASAIQLSGTWPSSWYPSDSCHAPLAVSPASGQDGDFLTAPNTPLLGGYIEIDIQTPGSPATWVNVTSDVLSQGITNDNPSAGNPCVVGGKNYYPVLHLEEVNKYPCISGTCAAEPSTSSYDYVPLNMYDAREGNLRDNSTPVGVYANGVINVVELDVQDLQWWFANDTFGKQALNNSGYIVYFSDRRGNYDPAATATNGETGVYGNEDIINPSSSTGILSSVPTIAGDPSDATPDDVNQNGVVDTYGATPACADPGSPANSQTPNPCYQVSSPLRTPTPEDTLSPGQAEKNAVIFFRHALRLVNGSLGNLPPLTTANCSITQGASGSGGFTVASENPVYILGDYNASSTGGSTFNDQPGQCHVPAAVMADAVTLLSDPSSGGWTDLGSFYSPTSMSTGSTWASNTTYTLGATVIDSNGNIELAIVAGKSGSSHPTWPTKGHTVTDPTTLTWENIVAAGRQASTTYYRAAIMGGTNIPFQSYQSGTTNRIYSYSYPQDFGTDGGVHNFLRYLENWGGQTLYYRGSIVDFYYSREATGAYKCCTTVYSPPTRGYNFDMDFDSIATLPPGTPRFTAVNALGFQQVVQAK